MAHVLVTGASGFIGKQLVEALRNRGDDVICLVRATSRAEPLEKLGVRLATGDIVEPQSLAAAVANVDTVYHLAGLNRANSLAEYCRVNEAGVRNVIQACARRTTPPVVLLLSSLSAAGPMQEDQLRTESDPPRPVSNYGLSKRAGELAAEALAGEAPITVIRPPIVFGPGDAAALSLFRSIRKLGLHLMMGLGRHVSLVYVSDLASTMIRAAERSERLPAPARCGEKNSHLTAANAGCGYYFLASEEHPTYADLGRMIGMAVQRPNVRLMRVPRLSVYALAAINELRGRVARRPQYLNFDRIREMTAGHWICSPEKARRELGFSATASLQEQLEQTAQWYRQAGWM